MNFCGELKSDVRFLPVVEAESFTLTLALSEIGVDVGAKKHHIIEMLRESNSATQQDAG